MMADEIIHKSGASDSKHNKRRSKKRRSEGKHPQTTEKRIKMEIDDSQEIQQNKTADDCLPDHDALLLSQLHSGFNVKAEEPEENLELLHKILMKYNSIPGGFKPMYDELRAHGLSLETGPWKPYEVHQLQLNWDFYKASHSEIQTPEKLLFPYNYPDEFKELKKLSKETHLNSILSYRIKRPVRQSVKKAEALLLDWKGGKYSKDEMKMLDQMKYDGKKWVEMSAVLNRNSQTIRSVFTKCDKNFTRGSWTKKEDKLLLKVMESYKCYDELKGRHYYSWQQISKIINRSDANCKKRHTNVLSWKQTHDAEHRPRFSTQDNILLLELVCDECVQSESEIDWPKLMQSFHNVPNEAFLQSKWQQLKMKVPMYQIKSLDDVTDHLIQHEMPKLEAKLQRKIARAEQRARDRETSQASETETKQE